MTINRIVEYAFFFTVLLGSGYMVWKIFAPFVTALVLAVIITTICYPLYEQIEKRVYKQNKSLASIITTLIVVLIVILPLFFIFSVFAKEAVSFFNTLGSEKDLALNNYLVGLEASITSYATDYLRMTDFNLNLIDQIKNGASFIIGNVGTILVNTASTIFLIIISLFGSFYFFRDGKEFMKIIFEVSPLPDSEDRIIFARIATAMRSVAMSVVLSSIVQGIFVALGFTIFGISRGALWGAIAAILSLIPGIGTATIMIPAVIYLFFTSTVFNAVGLLVWAILMIVLIDNTLSPHLMSRGNNLHPFFTLVSVLGGIAVFGPIGFIVGPVVITLFAVLLEVYNQYILVNGKGVKIATAQSVSVKAVKKKHKK